ncbi:MAG: hypothetical protein ACXWU1_06630 [Allosphingosinicella sp.]
MVWTAHRRVALARARRAPAAETRRIRMQLAGRHGDETADSLAILSAASAAGGGRAVLHLIDPAPALTAATLPWPEEAPDQHLIATRASR